MVCERSGPVRCVAVREDLATYSWPLGLVCAKPSFAVSRSQHSVDTLTADSRAAAPPQGPAH